MKYSNGVWRQNKRIYSYIDHEWEGALRLGLWYEGEKIRSGKNYKVCFERHMIWDKMRRSRYLKA